MKRIGAIAIVAVFVAMMFASVVSAQVGILEVVGRSEIPPVDKQVITPQFAEIDVDGSISTEMEYGQQNQLNMARTEFSSTYTSGVPSPLYADVVIMTAYDDDYLYIYVSALTNASINSSYEVLFYLGIDSTGDNRIQYSKDFYVQYDGNYNDSTSISWRENGVDMINTTDEAFGFARSYEEGNQIAYDYEMQIEREHLNITSLSSFKFSAELFIYSEVGSVRTYYAAVDHLCAIKMEYKRYWSTVYDVETIGGTEYKIIVCATAPSSLNVSDVKTKSNYNFVFDATRTMTVPYEDLSSGTILFAALFNDGTQKLGGWFPDMIVFVWLNDKKYQIDDDSVGLNLVHDTGEHTIYEYTIPADKIVERFEIIIKPSFWDKADGAITRNL